MTPLRILGETAYPAVVPSARVRIADLAPFLDEHGVLLEHRPTLTDEEYGVLASRSSAVRKTAVLARAAARSARARPAHDLLLVHRLRLLAPLPGIDPPRRLDVYDLDDALYLGSAAEVNRRFAWAKQEARRCVAMMRRARLVLAGNAYLASSAGEHARRVEVVPSCVDPERQPVRAHADTETVTIGWIGSSSTSRYLEPVLAIIARMVERGVGVRLVTVGADLDARAPWLESRPWELSRQAEDLASFDVGIMPLPDSEWTRGKCGYKVLQYFSAGVPAVASPVGVDTRAGGRRARHAGHDAGGVGASAGRPRGRHGRAARTRRGRPGVRERALLLPALGARAGRAPALDGALRAMCGIAGAVHLTGGAAERGPDQLACMRHRGPDAEGVFERGCGWVGQTRLAIIDLPHGDPPIANEDGTIGVALNGEIYNYRELRTGLRERGHVLSTEGDTEVGAHLAEELDPVSLAVALEGMFALAVWDEPRGRLVLARDRFGKKPLYYWHEGPRLVFGSEIKAVLAHPRVPRELHAAVIPDYLTFGYVPTPDTFFAGIRSVPPGHVLVAERGEVRISRYWAPRWPGADDVPRLDGSAEHQVGEVRRLLRAGVERRLIADVPLGAFLSGGIDSSAVVGLMAQASRGPVATFTIGFEDDEGFDERPYARAVAEKHGTDHTEFVVRPDAASLLEQLVWHYDQPFGDSSSLPTYLLSELTSGHVKVALCGDGGDELFGGYERFGAALALSRYERVVPGPVRARGAAAGFGRRPCGRPGPGREGAARPAAQRHAGARRAARLGLLRLGREPVGARGCGRERGDRRLPAHLGCHGRRPPAGPAARPQHPHLPARRPAAQGRPHGDGPRSRGPLAVPGPRVGRAGVPPPPVCAGDGRPARHGVEADLQGGRRRPAARWPARPPQAGLRGPAGPLVPRPTSRRWSTGRSALRTPGSPGTCRGLPSARWRTSTAAAPRTTGTRCGRC